MGMSNAYGGPSGRAPLVPTWLDPEDGGAPAATGGGFADGGAPGDAAPGDRDAPPPTRPIPQPPPFPGRFRAARGSFSRFAGSGGSDRGSLGRAIAGYISTASGGPRQAARRMGSSQRAGANLLGFLSDVRARGAREALRALNLEGLAGRPIEDIFLGLAAYVCPEGGTVDAGIARNAFIETIADLAGLGITDLDALTADQMQSVFELYAAHAIEARLCNDIGTKSIILPTDVRAAVHIQAQLWDFIRRGVADALTAAKSALTVLTANRVLGFVGRVYEAAFRILQAMGEAAAEAA